MPDNSGSWFRPGGPREPEADNTDERLRSVVKRLEPAARWRAAGVWVGGGTLVVAAGVTVTALLHSGQDREVRTTGVGRSVLLPQAPGLPGHGAPTVAGGAAGWATATAPPMSTARSQEVDITSPRQRHRMGLDPAPTGRSVPGTAPGSPTGTTPAGETSGGSTSGTAPAPSSQPSTTPDQATPTSSSSPTTSTTSQPTTTDPSPSSTPSPPPTTDPPDDLGTADASAGTPAPSEAELAGADQLGSPTTSAS